MKYIKTIIFFLISAIASGQCKKDTSVQYYDSTYQSYSQSNNVTVEFGTGSEISNNYNYINYESEDLYCIIYGFDKKYEVKLFTNYSSIYKTSCSSISNIFTNGFIKGKDQDGRIWKIKKSSSENYSDDSYTSSRKYNKPTSSINHKYIASTLNSLQAKIDYNKKLVGEAFTSFRSRKKDLFNEISTSKIPIDKKENLQYKYQVLIDNKIDDCSYLADFDSLEGTLTTINCLNGIHNILDSLENEIERFIPPNNSKQYSLISVAKKDVPYCNIISINNIEGQTAVQFEYISPYSKDNWINIDPKTYLYDATNNRNFRLESVRGIEYSPEKKIVSYNKKVRFTLYFSQIPLDAKKLSIIECERASSNCFNFYGVIVN
jgi:hypothetical protein